jgi:Xaa-Pro aminopeptidase
MSFSSWSCWTPAARLAVMRSKMAARSLDAFIVPSADAHASEYVAEADKRRAYISGFSGSAGTAVVTSTEARLWTDGRYFLQAVAQLDSEAWALMKDRLKETPSVEAWLTSALPSGSVVGIDPFTTTVGGMKKLREGLAGAGVRVDADGGAGNLVDSVWSAEGGRPAVPTAPLREHPLEYAGVSAAAKLVTLRLAMAEAGADYFVVSALDEVAWLTNMRGADVECNPVFLAYVLVGRESAVLFVDAAKVGPRVASCLMEEGFSVEPYENVRDVVRGAVGTVWVDSTTCPWALYEDAMAGAAPGQAGRVLDSKPSPLTLAKAIKCSAELNGMRAAHARDGAALTTFLAWLEIAVQRGTDARTGAPLAAGALTEDAVAAVLDGMRAALPYFVSPSFETISGYGANGAIIHYRAKAGTAATVGANALFLLDSGGQYVDGTTDVTRTVHMGKPNTAEKAAYTAVLKGHIALARAVFPPGTSGIALDAIARSQLWATGRDYRHGTGHGVGAALNVHEGPQGLATVARNDYTGGMLAGMTISNEPGYYEDGRFGIRIETVCVAREAAAPAPEACFGGNPFLELETLTVTPISSRLVDVGALTDAERSWLNTYNARCRRVLAPALHDVAWALQYLLKETHPV